MPNGANLATTIKELEVEESAFTLKYAAIQKEMLEILEPEQKRLVLLATLSPLVASF